MTNARSPQPIVTAAAVILGICSQAAEAAQTACPPPPSPVRDLAVAGYYSDDAKSRIDAAALARHRGQTQVLRRFLGQVSKASDRAVIGPRHLRDGQAACAIRWLNTWADGRAFLGRMVTRQAEAQQRWALAGSALVYLKVRRFAAHDDQRRIAQWLGMIATRAQTIFADRGRVHNNHRYWLGLGLGAVGLATASQHHWHAARRIMHDATGDVTSHGLLPLELRRGRRALHYHDFALQPLVVLAELAAVRGEDWYRFNNGALHRLVAITVAGLNMPQLFDRLAGAVQERPIRPRAGWLQLYDNRFPVRLPALRPVVATYDRRFGGSVAALVVALRTMAPAGAGPRALHIAPHKL